ncbi:MAG: hypothetical protein IT207_05160 [Fimbriimonadaceae bacterium]|nr:hypothetical protein [Fimbriimonadaceae bacterium]
MEGLAGKRVLEAVEAMVAKYPQVVVSRNERGLTLTGSPGGFDIKVTDDGHEGTVWTGIWHDHLDDPEQAAHLVAWLLSPRARVTEKCRAGKVTFTSLHLMGNDGTWNLYSHVGRLTLAFGQKTTRVTSNSVIAPEDVPQTNRPDAP